MKDNFRAKYLKRKSIRKKVCFVVAIIAVMSLTLIVGTSDCYAFGYTPEVAKRWGELLEQGYTMEQINDQIREEFDGINGVCGTGGIDGKLLDGSEAPNDAKGNPKPSTSVGNSAPSGSTGNHGTGAGSGTSNPTGTAAEQTPVHTHEWNETVTKNPTCTEKGVKTYTCSCGDAKTENIARIDHNYVISDTVMGTCMEPGCNVYTCEMCGDSYSVDMEYGSHVYTLTEDGIEPACTEDGVKYKVCAVCGDRVEEILPATGHDIDTNATVDKNATCTEDGVKTYRCKNCGEADREEKIPATGHVKGEELIIIKEATFFNDGEGRYLCTECEEVLETVKLVSLYSANKVFFWITAAAIIAAVLTLTVVIVAVSKKKRK